VSEAPLIFEENEKVWTVQVREGVSSYVFRENSDDLLWAAAVCPVSAIKLRLDTGEVVDGDSEVIRAFLASARKR
jgi:ferredoxin